MFVIFMEALSRMFSPIVNEGFLSCFFVGFSHSSGLTIHTYCLQMILWFFMGPILTTFIIYVLYFYVFLCFEAVYYLVFYALKINVA
jgi:hypothetical protein